LEARAFSRNLRRGKALWLRLRRNKSRRAQLLTKLIHCRLDLRAVFVAAFAAATGELFLKRGVLLRSQIAIAELERDQP